MHPETTKIKKKEVSDGRVVVIEVIIIKQK